MSEYKFNYEDTEYVLNANNCSELINDEEKPVKGITVDSILNMLNICISIVLPPWVVSENILWSNDLVKDIISIPLFNPSSKCYVSRNN